MLIGSDKRKGNERERKRGGLAGLREDSWDNYWEEARAEKMEPGTQMKRKLVPEIGGIPETQEASATRQREVDEHGYELWLAVGDI